MSYGQTYVAQPNCNILTKQSVETTRGVDFNKRTLAIHFYS